MRVSDRRRHQFRRLVAGVAEHDALVARAFFAIVAGLVGVDALRDVGGLRMQEDLDVGLVPVEAVLLVADVLDRHAGGMGNPVLGDVARPAHFASDHDAVGRRQRLAGDTDLIGIDTRTRAFAEVQVDDLVGDAVAHLVGLALGNRFAGELIILSGHRFHLQIVCVASSKLAPRPPNVECQPPLLTGGVRVVKVFESPNVLFIERKALSKARALFRRERVH